MTDLVAFLLARLNEDEQAGRAAEEETGPRWEDNGFGVFILGTAQPIAVGRHDGCVPDDARAHMVRHDPARVLAEVDAKRRIISDELDRVLDAGGTEAYLNRSSVMRLLALPYAGHPDYRPEWAPKS